MMIRLPPRRLVVYYLWGLLPCVLAAFVFYYLSVSVANTILFAVAYFWHFTLNVPETYWDSYLKRRHYRFSTIRLVILFHRFLKKELSPFLKYSFLVRLISPSLFNILLIVISSQGNFLYSLAGSLIFEGIFYLSPKKNLKAE
ncbi:MAG: hypothetical protein OXB84_01375 [Halobacteriovoraceae bacterium]|nr:hypothetical protein [Halobacteriovoraceae bacterium]